MVVGISGDETFLFGVRILIEIQKAVRMKNPIAKGCISNFILS